MAQRVKGSSWPTDERCQLALRRRRMVGIDPYLWESPGGWRMLSGERFGFGEPTWMPRGSTTLVTAKVEGWASALRTTAT